MENVFDEERAEGITDYICQIIHESYQNLDNPISLLGEDEDDKINTEIDIDGYYTALEEDVTCIVDLRKQY